LLIEASISQAMKSLCLLICACLIVGSVAARDTRPEARPAAPWVTQNTYDYNKTALDKDAEDGNVDIAYEMQFSVADQATYCRRIYRVLTDAGVENVSDISVTYDPGYSRLAFNTVNIIRDGKRINCLDLSHVKLVQKETELSRHIYNGSVSAELFLEDVRKGDVIDYSYTITGWNPVMTGKFSYLLPADFSYPFYNVYYKIVAPSSRPLQVANILTKVPYAVNTSGGQTVYEWRLTDLRPVHEDERTPSWNNAYNYVLISEFASWNEVAQWALKLYPTNIPVSGELKAMIAGIMARYPGDEDRLLAALHFVQDKVRYLGIEMGINSHTPHDPSQIFRQRYGDCKDKAYLLCAMLRAMHIEADPVLINTEDKHAIAGYLPSPKDFNHVTVRASVNGKYYWLDGTISGQRGRLEDISFPNYETGLVVAPGTTGLTPIPLQDRGRKIVTETIDIPNLGGDARLTVVSRFSGSEADDVRSAFESNSHAEIQRSYKDFYARYFDKIEADSIISRDDSLTGVFECREYYTLHNIWKVNKEKQSSWFYGYVVDGEIRKPGNKSRTAPFALTFPVHCTEDVIVNLPSDWNLPMHEEEIVACAAFRFKSRYLYAVRRLQLHYEYDALKDHIEVAELPQYLEAYDKVDNLISYGVETGSGIHSAVDDGDASGHNSAYSFLAVAVIFAGIYWRVRRYRGR
jgi:transglutaminase-like putative cysteine protease